MLIKPTQRVHDKVDNTLISAIMTSLKKTYIKKKKKNISCRRNLKIVRHGATTTLFFYLLSCSRLTEDKQNMKQLYALRHILNGCNGFNNTIGILISSILHHETCLQFLKRLFAFTCGR